MCQKMAPKWKFFTICCGLMRICGYVLRIDAHRKKWRMMASPSFNAVSLVKIKLKEEFDLYLSTFVDNKEFFANIVKQSLSLKRSSLETILNT